MNGFAPDDQLGARRQTAGSRSGGRRRLAGPTGTSRASEWAARTTRPAGERWGSTAGTTRSAREAGLPRSVSHRRAPRATRPAGSEHAVVIVVAVVVVPEDYGAGKEYDRQDENDPGDNHHPRCGRVEPGWLGPWRRRRSRGDGSRLVRRFGCFAHTLNIVQADIRRKTFRQQTCCESRRGSLAPVPQRRAARRSGERRATGCWLLARRGPPLTPRARFVVDLLAPPRTR
jgi:hypothetical protein